MKSFLTIFLSHFLLFLPTSIYAESNLEISLLTCSSSTPLYATFGHSAIRVQDLDNNKDLAFDFGVFDFNDPFFLIKFLKGELQYSLEVRSFDRFLYSYQQEGRSVVEEKLNVTHAQAASIYQQLMYNLQPENKYYRYDFLYDNCSTRIRDLLFSLPIIFPEKDQITSLTFREQLHTYLTNKSWIKLGIDILLGRSTDNFMMKQEQLFLPNQLSEHLKKVRILKEGVEHNLLLAPKKIVLAKNTPPNTALQYGTPFLICSLLVFLFAAWSWKKKKVDTFLWYLLWFLGLIGLFLLAMWLFTNHPTSANNWNLWWANPLYLVALVIGLKRLGNGFLWGLLFLNTLLFLAWNALPQQLNFAILPILFGLVFLLIQKIRQTKKVV